MAKQNQKKRKLKEIGERTIHWPNKNCTEEDFRERQRKKEKSI
jgi:hypothetical protein